MLGFHHVSQMWNVMIPIKILTKDSLVPWEQMNPLNRGLLSLALMEPECAVQGFIYLKIPWIMFSNKS